MGVLLIEGFLGICYFLACRSYLLLRRFDLSFGGRTGLFQFRQFLLRLFQGILRVVQRLLKAADPLHDLIAISVQYGLAFIVQLGRLRAVQFFIQSIGLGVDLILVVLVIVNLILAVLVIIFEQRIQTLLIFLIGFQQRIRAGLLGSDQPGNLFSLCISTGCQIRFIAGPQLILFILVTCRVISCYQAQLAENVLTAGIIARDRKISRRAGALGVHIKSLVLGIKARRKACRIQLVYHVGYLHILFERDIRGSAVHFHTEGTFSGKSHIL